MNVLLDSSKIAGEHVHLIKRNVLLDAFSFAHHVNAFEVFILVKSSDVTRVKNVVNILDHLLVDNLSIAEQERRGFAFHSSLHKAGLKVFSPVGHVVAFDDLNLEALLIAHVG